MNRARALGLALVIAVGVQLWVTTRVPGYELQVLSALVTVGLALGAVALLVRSLEGVAGGE